jgi:hypothetical protein
VRPILVVLTVIGSTLLAFLLAGILFAHLRFFIWLAIIGLVVWGSHHASERGVDGEGGARGGHRSGWFGSACRHRSE